MPSDSEKIVPERDTYDPTLGQCTGKCNIMGVGLSQCMECGWDETHGSFNPGERVHKLKPEEIGSYRP